MSEVNGKSVGPRQRCVLFLPSTLQPRWYRFFFFFFRAKNTIWKNTSRSGRTRDFVNISFGALVSTTPHQCLAHHPPYLPTPEPRTNVKTVNAVCNTMYCSTHFHRPSARLRRCATAAGRRSHILLYCIIQACKPKTRVDRGKSILIRLSRTWTNLIRAYSPSPKLRRRSRGVPEFVPNARWYCGTYARRRNTYVSGSGRRSILQKGRTKGGMDPTGHVNVRGQLLRWHTGVNRSRENGLERIDHGQFKFKKEPYKTEIMPLSQNSTRRMQY